MRGVNKVIIVGNLGADPEVKQFQNGGNVTSISVATSEQWNDKQTGERREQTEWHRISLYNKLGEIAAQYLRKGSSVYIEGSLRTRKYQDQNGQERYITEIRADQMQMLGGTMSGQNMGSGQNTGGYNSQGNSFANNGSPNMGNNNTGYNNPNYANQNNQNFNAPSANAYANPNQGNPYQGNAANSQQVSGNTPPQENNPFLNDNKNPTGQPNANTSNASATGFNGTPKPGVVDDDVPFMAISNQIIGIV